MARRMGVLLVLLAALATAGAIGGALAGAGTAWWLLQQGQVARVLAPVVRGLPEAASTLAAPPVAEEAATLDAVRATRPAVVTVWNIRYVKTSFFAPAELRVYGEGSGVIFDERGYIATNAHVVDGAERVELVFLDGRRAPAEIVRADPEVDVAILRTDAELPAVATLADSSTLEPGMRVLAIGSPLGTQYQNTVTTGIIAGLNRRVTHRLLNWLTGQEREVDVIGAPLIQTDAAINSGNSGGPLVNLQGQVVALSTLIVRQGGGTSVEGLGFAIPSNVVRALADEWIDGRPRGWLGIDFEPIDPVLAQDEGLSRGTGARVTRAHRGVAAGDVLVPGDLVTAIGGVELDLDHALADQLWRYRAGDTVSLRYEREGQSREAEVRLAAAPGSGG